MTNKISEPYTKEVLKAIMRMKKGKFISHMKTLEPELLAKFPRYNKRCSILPDNVFKWICEEYGLTIDEIIQRFMIFHGIENQIDIQRVYANFGMTKI